MSASGRMAVFAVASLLPVALLALGIGAGRVWLVAALAYMTLLAAVLDQLVPLVMPEAPEGAEFPAADALLVVLALAHLLLLPLTVFAVAGDSGLGAGERVLAFLSAGLILGQISVPAAHELIHRGNRGLYRLGVAIYVSLLFGHHASAHRLVHHRSVGTAADPNSARRGESLYRFIPRAWAGSFRAGLAAERARQPRQWRGAYAAYVAGGLGCLALAGAIAGPAGVAVWVALALWATAQLLMSDYVQHYGLRRAASADGRPEPVGAQHSWNAPHWFSAAFMLNAPRHSDHHAHPARPYPALRLPAEVPMLPWPLPVMAALALLPRQWRRVMHPRLAALAGRSRESDGGGAGAGRGDLAG